jgi:hypothetical protein
MTQWLLHKEALQWYEKFIHWQLTGQSSTIPSGSLSQSECCLVMTKEPSATHSEADIIRMYGTTFLNAAVSCYACLYENPQLSGRALENAADDFSFDVGHIHLWHCIKFCRKDPISGATNTVDSIHIQPAHSDQRRGIVIPGRFDAALIRV